MRPDTIADRFANHYRKLSPRQFGIWAAKVVLTSIPVVGGPLAALLEPLEDAPTAGKSISVVASGGYDIVSRTVEGFGVTSFTDVAVGVTDITLCSGALAEPPLTTIITPDGDHRALAETLADGRVRVRVLSNVNNHPADAPFKFICLARTGVS